MCKSRELLAIFSTLLVGTYLIAIGASPVHGQSPASGVSFGTPVGPQSNGAVNRLPESGQPPVAAKNRLLPPVPTVDDKDRPLPINLPAALQLAGANPLDIAFAIERLHVANALLEQANVLWLPTLNVGADYYRSDGHFQEDAGDVIHPSKSSFMVGAAPNVVFAVTDAIFAPLVAKQVVLAREGDLQTAHNDSMLAVADAYFTVEQARGEVAGAGDALRRTTEMVKRIDKLAEGLSPAFESNRARTELARRRQALETAYEHWETAGAELNRLLRLNPSAMVEPVEAPQLQVQLVDLAQPIDDLIALALTHRPELASHQALIQAALAKVRQEKIRPLLPTVMLQGDATPSNTLGAGYFGGGINENMSNFGARSTFDLQFIWELKNLGFGNQASVHQRQAEEQQAWIDLYRTQDRVAAEVVQAHAQAKRACNRVKDAEEGLENAIITAEKNLEGVQQTKKVGNLLVLVSQPLDVVAAIQALNQAYIDYYTAIADANRAQFRLYRNLGQPAQHLTELQQSSSLGLGCGVANAPGSPGAPK
jgi:outer membrane protein TolC